MKLSGKYKLNVKKEAVWKALNDPNILKQCIPGCETFEKNSDNTFNASATNQIGPMNTSFTGSVNLSNIKPNESYTLSGEGNSSVGFVNGNANVKLTEENSLTILTYEVDINVGGKIAQLGSRLINGVAKKMSDYFFGRFADLVSPLETNVSEVVSFNNNQKRVKILKSNFLNNYIYSSLLVFILLLVVIFYFVSR
jgi:carbon monoxide dehydrogenase subunit G